MSVAASAAELVAGINMLWMASERSVRDSVRNAAVLAHQQGWNPLACPAIGAGSGGMDEDRAIAFIVDELTQIDVPVAVRLVRFRRALA